ncbi:hypothetical protein KP626_06250 [Christensenella sp. MSJ-20]|uniref:DUF6054 family protein n=1 Tax=Christensenella sp. MSJ-20 TaxID=2841518 RepID=UPI001C742971|nr:hypothetical protein KP626_06250 [Christensenella sp. MSJ-20]
MAKYQCVLEGDFDELLRWVDGGIIGGSASASYEDGADYDLRGVRCAVRVYERYSYLGSNRVSASVTLVGDGQRVYLTIITSGGSEAVYVKMNTFGEKNFLKQIQEVVERFENRGT